MTGISLDSARSGGGGGGGFQFPVTIGLGPGRSILLPINTCLLNTSVEGVHLLVDLLYFVL